METWDREKLYAEVWAQPATKVAEKYGISSVALGKVCEKLQIPTPPRGYWIKKEFGKPVKQLPLPPGKDLPVVHRVKFPSERSTEKNVEETPSDPEYLRIVEFESRQIRFDPNTPWRPVVRSAERILKQAEPDNRGMLQPSQYGEACLDVRVSRDNLKRALNFINAVISTLDTEGIPVRIESGRRETYAEIFGHKIRFVLAERSRVVSQREIKEYSSWTRKVTEYLPTGVLEFRVGEYYSPEIIRDGKRGRLEMQLSSCIAALFREGREGVLIAKRIAEREALEAAEELKREELAGQIAEEERKVKELLGWVRDWRRAQSTREFISVLEKVWGQAGFDLSPEAEKGKRIAWMKQQADRLDPMLESPPSILDRKVT